MSEQRIKFHLSEEALVAVEKIRVLGGFTSNAEAIQHAIGTELYLQENTGEGLACPYKKMGNLPHFGLAKVMPRRLGFYKDRWCRKRMGWLRWALLYRKCRCPEDRCYPMGREGPEETR